MSTRESDLVHAVTCWAAATVTDPGELPVIVSDLGRQYAWPWWNVLLAQPALRELSGGGPAVAATGEVWSLLGHVPGAGPIHWLNPVYTVTRGPADGRPSVVLPPGTASPRGVRSWRRREPQAVQSIQVWIEATRVPDPRSYMAWQLATAAAEAARVTSVLCPPAAQPFDVICRIAMQLLALGIGDPDSCPAPLMHGLPVASPAPASAVAAAAAQALLAAHRLTLPLLPAGTAGEIAAAIASHAHRLDDQQVTALGVRTLHSISELLHTLLGMLGRPAWNGGLLTLACTGDSQLSAPRLTGDTDSAQPRGH